MTTPLDVSSSAAGQQPAAKPSSWGRIAGVFVAPGETMRDIALRPTVLVALIVLLVFSIASTVVIVNKIDFASAIRSEMDARGNEMSKEDADRIVRMGAAFAKVAAWASPILSIGFLALIAGIMLLAFRLFGGDGGFKSAFAIATYGWYPLLIKSMIAVGVVLTRHTQMGVEEMATLVQSNPGRLVSMRAQPVLFSLLTSFDIFTIWSLVLMTLGYAAMSKFSRGRSAALVFGLWAAMVVVKVGFAAIGASR